MKEQDIRAEMIRHGFNAADIARSIGCDESVVSRLLKTGWPGEPESVRRTVATVIARRIRRKFDEVWK